MIRALASRLTQYDEYEAKSIIRLLLQEIFGMTLTDICSGALNSLSDSDHSLLERLVLRLEKGEPIQYVIGHTDFCHMTFNVRKGCLIPRPETEELCYWIAEENDSAQKILDIGTGSGCIAISMNKLIPTAKVTAWDISNDALEIAQENAKHHNADITFVQQDALNTPNDICKWDIIVSNPPYICRKESIDMEKNVLDYEPDNALFVPDNNPLLFYESIISYAQKALKPNGTLYFEINPIYANDIKKTFLDHGFDNIGIRKDFEGKKRMIRGTKQT